MKNRSIDYSDSSCDSFGREKELNVYEAYVSSLCETISMHVICLMFSRGSRSTLTDRKSGIYICLRNRVLLIMRGPFYKYRKEELYFRHIVISHISRSFANIVHISINETFPVCR